MTTPLNKRLFQILLITTGLVLAGLFLLRKTVFSGGFWNIFFIITTILAATLFLLSVYCLHKNNSSSVQRENKIPPELAEMIQRAILETSPDAFAITDLTGRLIFCSQQTAKLHGYDNPEDLLGKSAFVLLPFKEVIRATKYLKMTRQGGIIKNVELTLLKKDGSIFHAELSAALIKNEMGIPTAFMATFRDVTERRWVEEQIRESEARYRIVADNTFDWEFWQAPNDRFIYTSPSCKRITGWDAIEFIKNPSLINNIIHPDDQINFETHTHETKTNKTPGEVEFRIIRADGRELWISHICQPVFDESGQFIGTRGSNRDITERKHAESELQLANEKLRLQLAEIEGLQVILRKQALHDPLTGLYNRRYMEESLRKELARATRENYQVCVAVLDMDNLKVFNDNFGHAVGDKALVVLSDKLRELTRTDDVICRYGGDEFLVILHKTNLEDGFNRVEQWRKTMEEIRITDQAQDLQVTFTAGISTYPIHGKTLEEIIKAADDALYVAKKKGRNQVMIPNQSTH